MKKFLAIVAMGLGLLGFLLILGGVGHIETNPDGFFGGIVVAIIGLGILAGVVIGLFSYNRLQALSWPFYPSAWEKKRRKRLGLHF